MIEPPIATLLPTHNPEAQARGSATITRNPAANARDGWPRILRIEKLCRSASKLCTLHRVLSTLYWFDVPPLPLPSLSHPSDPSTMNLCRPVLIFLLSICVVAAAVSQETKGK